MDQQKSISESNCPPNEGYVMLIKSLRKRLHDEIEALQAETEKCSGRERALAITKLQEARMWLGMVLQKTGEPYPYPNGESLTTPYFDPPADIN